MKDMKEIRILITADTSRWDDEDWGDLEGELHQAMDWWVDPRDFTIQVRDVE